MHRILVVRACRCIIHLIYLHICTVIISICVCIVYLFCSELMSNVAEQHNTCMSTHSKKEEARTGDRRRVERGEGGEGAKTAKRVGH
mmetsp:Transcript_49968/g.125278  ORF Transcript_49968/g.125278 Transcript_49968/m.125278 type:complete len:87 (-) Transcript_49968:2396-2656(-)